jgi:hypothetical protein
MKIPLYMQDLHDAIRQAFKIYGSESSVHLQKNHDLFRAVVYGWIVRGLYAFGEARAFCLTGGPPSLPAVPRAR